MKYAGKPQKLNPNKPLGSSDWDVWECIHVSDDTATLLKSQGWYISDSDNMAQWFQIKKITPKSVTPRQARQALILNGITPEQINSALNSLPSPMKELALQEWEYSIEIQRDRKLVMDAATRLGWSEIQLDQFFIFAGGL